MRAGATAFIHFSNFAIAARLFSVAGLDLPSLKSYGKALPMSIRTAVLLFLSHRLSIPQPVLFCTWRRNTFTWWMSL